MKKAILKVFFFGAVGLMVFASCRKNRVCVCTDTSGQTDTTTIYLSTKSDAEVICDSYENNYHPSCELN